MVNIKELRLNNLVYQYGEISHIYTLDRGGISFCRINDLDINKQSGLEYESHEDVFSPIILTQEILLKCGLTKPFTNGHTYIKDTMSIVFYNGIIENVGGVQIKIKSLHQLQNLYFLLSGKELEITL